MNRNKITKNIEFWVCVTLGLGFGLPAYSQYDVGFTHYMFNEVLINPAYTGSKEALSINGLGRLQWVGFDGAPQTYNFNGHAPLANDHIGLGAGLLYDKIGVSNRTIGYVNFAYRLLFPRSKLSFGLQGSAGGQNVNFENLKNMTDDIIDDDILQGVPVSFIPNIGFGIMYYTKKFYVGASIPRMMNNNFVEGQNERFNFKDWTYYLSSGYTFEVNRDFSIMPSVMLKMTQGVRPQIDITATALLWQTLWLGLDYRTDNTLAPIIGIQLNQYFRFNYSYDVSLDAAKRENLGGAHEISLMYTFDYLRKRVVSPRLF